MTVYSWDTCPPSTRAEVGRFVDRVEEILGRHMVGIYLHGSLAMGCFNRKTSDLDLLVVTDGAIRVEEKRLCVEALIDISDRPHPIEVSFLVLGDIRVWRHPAPFDLHFSESWRDRLSHDIAAGRWRNWNEKQRTDADLAAHLTLVRERGIRLRGPKIEDIFPTVPAPDYLDSILRDYSDARASLLEQPVYGVLNMMRVYCYVAEGRITSKSEAAEWVVQTLPLPLKGVVETVLKEYRGECNPPRPSSEELKELAAVVDGRLDEVLLALGFGATRK